MKKALPVILPLLLIGGALLFNPSFAVAAPTSSREIRDMYFAKQQQNAAGTGVGTAARRMPSTRDILQKIFLGVNASGTYRNSVRAGDTRSGLTMLINGLTMMIILGVWGSIASGIANNQHKRQIANMRREVIREKEYRENMYFEAVETILEKLANPNLKGSAKANLTRQLKDIDPDGKIRDFLEGKAERPDLSDQIDASKKAKAEKKTRGDAPLKRPKKSSSKSPRSSSSSSRRDTDVEDSDLYDDDDDEENERQPKRKAAEEDEDKKQQQQQRLSKQPPQQRKKQAPAPAAPKPPSPPPSSSSSPGSSVSVQDLLTELNGSLEGVLPPAQKSKLVSYLENRLVRIKDEQKRAGVMIKIAERLGDDAYWIDYANKI